MSEQLSDNMVRELRRYAKRQWLFRNEASLVSTNALVRRGLVTGPEIIWPDKPHCYFLTRSGRLVLELLDLVLGPTT